MKTLTICGSMRFSREMQEIAWKLETGNGFNVLQCVYGDGEPDDAARRLLKQAHDRKIDLSDGIYVVDIGGYYGESVRAEIEYARSHGKEVLFHSECSEETAGSW